MSTYYYRSAFSGNPFNPRTATQMCQSIYGHNSGNNRSRSNQPKAREIVKYSENGSSENFSAPSGNYQSSSNNWNHGKQK